MSSSIENLIARLWEAYRLMNPQADRIHQLLSARGETIVNDHIAFRTFQDPRVGIDVLAVPFLEAGYQEGGQYHFEEKKLFAKHFEHQDPSLPRIFISELLLDEFGDPLRSIVDGMLQQVPEPGSIDGPLCAAGRLWNVTYGQYESLTHVSEYASWMAAHGFRANHFTVLVNALNTIDSLEDLNQLLIAEGFALNEQGGVIKGTPEVYLEQSSTVASVVEVPFVDRSAQVPGCYYEFARRYVMPDGKLFGGFVAKSADKIFESTDTKLQK